MPGGRAATNQALKNASTKSYTQPSKAANDATAVSRRKLDNVLPTMDKHGVEDIVRNLSSTKSSPGYDEIATFPAEQDIPRERISKRASDAIDEYLRKTKKK